MRIQEQAKDHFRYVMWGAIDDPTGLEPKGEFFCMYREEWMPEIPGKLLAHCNVRRDVDLLGVFHKQQIKE